MFVRHRRFARFRSESGVSLIHVALLLFVMMGLSMFVTVSLGALVGVVVVAQTSYTAAIEHFQEFATVKALGGRNADVYRILLEQAAVAARDPDRAEEAMRNHLEYVAQRYTDIVEGRQ